MGKRKNENIDENTETDLGLDESQIIDTDETSTDSKSENTNQDDLPKDENIMEDEKLFSIEELGKKIRPYIFEGVKEYKLWATGKKVSKKDFEDALKAFLKSSSGGK